MLAETKARRKWDSTDGESCVSTVSCVQHLTWKGPFVGEKFMSRLIFDSKKLLRLGSNCKGMGWIETRQ